MDLDPLAAAGYLRGSVYRATRRSQGTLAVAGTGADGPSDLEGYGGNWHSSQLCCQNVQSWPMTGPVRFRVANHVFHLGRIAPWSANNTKLTAGGHGPNLPGAGNWTSTHPVQV